MYILFYPVKSYGDWKYEFFLCINKSLCVFDDFMQNRKVEPIWTKFSVVTWGISA